MKRPRGEPGGTRPGCRIVLHDVRKDYRIDGVVISALNGLSLEVLPGEYVAIMGPSGSGKSTLLNIIGCLDRPTGGSMVLDGSDTLRMSECELASARSRLIGFVFQSFELLPGISSLENVEIPLLYQGVDAVSRRRRSLEALGDVGLSKRARHRPTQLSGGEQQRVSIARALVHEPSLVLADEPTGNLDMGTGEEILNLLEEAWRRGLTLILVTHDREVASHAERVIHIRDGKAACGPTRGVGAVSAQGPGERDRSYERV